MGVRPEHFEGAEVCESRLPRIDMSAIELEALGSETETIFMAGAEPYALAMMRAVADDPLVASDRRARFTSRLDPPTAACVDDRLQLAIDTAELHSFDPGSESIPLLELSTIA